MKNRLQWLYDEYMSEKNSDQMDTQEHQNYMKNLAMEMFAIENLMKSDIAEHIKIHKSHRQDDLQTALDSSNWKWAMYELLKDEVYGAEKYLMLHDISVKMGKTDWANAFKAIARQETEHATMINNMYVNVAYTHGTPTERATWDKQYAMLIEKHKENVAKLSV